VFCLQGWRKQVGKWQVGKWQVKMPETFNRSGSWLGSILSGLVWFVLYLFGFVWFGRLVWFCLV
jgi:hypothetical protein